MEETDILQEIELKKKKKSYFVRCKTGSTVSAAKKVAKKKKRG